MRKPYRTISDVMDSPWWQMPAAKRTVEKQDRVLHSTKLEQSIYHDLRQGDAALDEVEKAACEKLRSFPALSQDVFQSFYSLRAQKHDEETLSATARKFNAPILEHITQSEEYPALKAVCEGRDLPAYEAASEFIASTAEELDDLISRFSGKKGALSTLEKLEQAKERAEDELSGLLEQKRKSGSDNALLDAEIVRAANEAESKGKQVAAVAKLIDASMAQNKQVIAGVVAKAVGAAGEAAQEVQTVIGAWSDAPADLKKSEINESLLERVRGNRALREISRYLGHFREMFAQGKRNGYAYGRGEKYTLELGRDLSRALTSELAMLAAPETLPLFLRKYQCRQIKQYRRREPIYKGAGDIICCLDESSSMEGEPIAWGKAVALTLLEIAADGGRKFALVHFSGPHSVLTHVFFPGAYSLADKFSAAETFLDGGTDFQTPMDEALRLMREDGFENADVVFITDGECSLPEPYMEQLEKEQAERCFTITGILMDQNVDRTEFSLASFCQKIYRTSEILGDGIVTELIGHRI